MVIIIMAHAMVYIIMVQCYCNGSEMFVVDVVKGLNQTKVLLQEQCPSQQVMGGYSSGVGTDNLQKQS